MTQDPNVLVAVDIGTTKVFTAVARADDGRNFRVLAHSVLQSEGVDRGNVTDTVEAAAQIRESIQDVARRAATTVNEAYVGITGSHVSYTNREDVIGWAASRGVITREDLEKVPATVVVAGARAGHTVIHALPRSYKLDGQSGVRDPLGMHTDRLEVDSHVISAKTPYTRSVSRAIEKAGLGVKSLVLAPIASAEAVLSEAEKHDGTMLVDIGGGTSDIIRFERGAVEYTSVLPVGGFQFTNDICIAFQTTFAAASAVKHQHGTTEPATLSAIDEVTLPGVGRGQHQVVPLRDISQLLRERAMELVRLVRMKMVESGIEDPGRCKLVLTGGCSKLPGLEDMFRRFLTPNVRVAGPWPYPGIPEEMRQPEYSTGVGLLHWAMTNPGALRALHTDGHQNGHTNGKSHESGAPRLLKWLFPN